MSRARVLLGLSVLAAAALTVAVWPLVARARRTAPGGAVSGQPAADRQDDVAGLQGALEVRGTRLAVRIARLHANANRQSLDADALGRHFGLGIGEPFLCEITSSSAGPDGPLLEGDVLGRGALRSLAVRDDRGLALATFTAPAAGPDEPADPLATLLSPPGQALRPGNAVSVVLWGREPESGARVVGLDAGEIVLAPARLSTRDLETALARIDVPDPPPARGAKQ